MTIYSLDVLLSQFWTSLLFHVQFCCCLSCIQVSQEAGDVVCYSHLIKNIPHFVVIHTIKGFGMVNETVDILEWNSLAFSVIQCLLAIWSLVYLPVLNPACISGISQFTYCWSPSLKDFEHNLAGMWNECNCMVIWSLGLLPFLNPSCTSGSLQFTYWWSLAWRILSIILLAGEMSAVVW